MAIGDIIKVKATFEFDTTYCLRPYMIHIAGNVYAIIYTGTSPLKDGKLITVNIIDGVISEPANNTLTFETTYCDYPVMIHVADDTYCLLYEGPDFDTYLRTFTIADDGQITPGELDNQDRSTTVEFLSIQYVSPGIFVFLELYGGGTSLPITWGIAANGDIDAELTSFKDLGSCDPSPSLLVTIAGRIYAYACSKESYSQGWVQTFSVDVDGTVNAITDDLKFEAVGCLAPTLFHVAGNVYAAAYLFGADSGKVTTFTIEDDGQVGASDINSYVFETVACNSLHVAQVAADMFAIAYDGPVGDGFIKTIKIDNAGQITQSVQSELEFDTADGHTPRIFHTTGNYYAVVYQGPDYDGFLKTIEITSSVPALNHSELIMGIGP